MGSLFGVLGYDESDSQVVQSREAAAVYTSVIDALVSCRAEAGLSQKQVAKAMGTTQSAISEFENVNRDARFTTLIRYAQAIGRELTIEIDGAGKKHVMGKGDWVTVNSISPVNIDLRAYNHTKWRRGHLTTVPREKPERWLFEAEAV